MARRAVPAPEERNSVVRQASQRIEQCGQFVARLRRADSATRCPYLPKLSADSRFQTQAAGFFHVNTAATASRSRLKPPRISTTPRNAASGSSAFASTGTRSQSVSR